MDLFDLILGFVWMRIFVLEMLTELQAVDLLIVIDHCHFVVCMKMLIGHDRSDFSLP